MKDKLNRLLEQLRDSEAYQQIKVKYDELDSQAKLYVNLGAIAGVVLLIFLSLVIAMAKLNSLKSEINEREETIGYLQRASDQIKQFQAQARAGGRVDTSSPLPSFVQGLLFNSGIDPSKADIGTEKSGEATKDTVEATVDVKLNQVNIVQIQRFLFDVTDQGTARGLNVKNLEIDTKTDPSGWMDASMTLSYYKAK